MKEMFFKLIGALKDRRFDMAGLAFIHLVVRSIKATIWLYFSSFEIGMPAFVFACIVWAATSTGPFVDLVLWYLIFNPSIRVSILGLERLGRWLNHTEQRVEVFEPRKAKEKNQPVYTSDSLTRLLENNPSTNFTLSDDGELVPVANRKHG